MAWSPESDPLAGSVHDTGRCNQKYPVMESRHPQGSEPGREDLHAAIDWYVMQVTRRSWRPQAVLASMATAHREL